MSDVLTAADPRPAVPFLKIPADGEPYLEGTRCQGCGAIYLGPRLACSKCGMRDRFEKARLSNRGMLHTYSIVHRSFPGVVVPFVSAVVDLDGGGCVKGNLIGVDPDPACIALGMAVELVYKDALGRTDSEGHHYLSYFFQPVCSASGQKLGSAS